MARLADRWRLEVLLMAVLAWLLSPVGRTVMIVAAALAILTARLTVLAALRRIL